MGASKMTSKTTRTQENEGSWEVGTSLRKAVTVCGVLFAVSMSQGCFLWPSGCLAGEWVNATKINDDTIKINVDTEFKNNELTTVGTDKFVCKDGEVKKCSKADAKDSGDCAPGDEVYEMTADEKKKAEEKKKTDAAAAAGGAAAASGETPKAAAIELASSSHSHGHSIHKHKPVHYHQRLAAVEKHEHAHATAHPLEHEHASHEHAHKHTHSTEPAAHGSHGAFVEKQHAVVADHELEHVDSAKLEAHHPAVHQKVSSPVHDPAALHAESLAEQSASVAKTASAATASATSSASAADASGAKKGALMRRQTVM